MAQQVGGGRRKGFGEGRGAGRKILLGAKNPISADAASTWFSTGQNVFLAFLYASNAPALVQSSGSISFQYGKDAPPPSSLTSSSRNRPLPPFLPSFLPSSLPPPPPLFFPKINITNNLIKIMTVIERVPKVDAARQFLCRPMSWILNAQDSGLGIS